MDSNSLKRKIDETNDKNGGEDCSYEEYVNKDNEKLRKELREIKDLFERQKRQKERLDERLKNELELRLKEKRESENVSINQRLELEKIRKERQLLENQLKQKDNELSKLKTALSSNTAKDDIECDKCDFRTRSEVSLILHTINHKLSHPNQRRLILHPNMFSSRNPNSSYLYMCPICEGTALTRNEIYPHIYQNHTKEKAYKCIDCDIFFTHIDYLKTHQKHEHERQRNTRLKNTSGYEINQTLITSVYKPSNNRGTQTVLLSVIGSSGDVSTTSGITNNSNNSYVYSPQLMADEQLKCSFPHCSFTTNNRQKLEFHISAHTNSKYKVCLFNTLLILISSIDYCNRFVPYQCPFCAYVGNILTDIYRHVKKSTKHEGKKVFECKFCDFGIDCEKSFKEHLRNKHFDEDAADKDIDAAVEDLFINKPSNCNTNDVNKK